MRGLTARQAASCEHATSRRCRCRCGGALHGAARVDALDLWLLDDDDPHMPHLGDLGYQLRLPTPVRPCVEVGGNHPSLAAPTSHGAAQAEGWQSGGHGPNR